MKKKIIFYILAAITISINAQVKPTVSWVNFMSDDATISAISTGLDGASKVYTTGRINFSTRDIRVQCTDSTGVVLWTYTYDNGGYDSPTKIRIDAAGNSFISGESYDPINGNSDYVVIKLDPSGNMVWVCRFDGSNNDDYATDVAVDANGDVYATGRSRNGSGNFDAITIKIDGNIGVTLWQHTINSANMDDMGVCLTLANSQADLIVGADSEFGSGFDILVYQLDAATGTPGWAQQLGGTNNSNDHISSIILSGANVVFAGMMDNSGTDEDYCLIKLDAAGGSPVFQRKYDFAANDRATSLVRDSTGNVVVTGYALNGSLYEYHTVMYDSTGSALWTHRKTTGCNALNVNPFVVCDTIAHHFYISGETEKVSRDVLVYQLTPGGNLGWEKSYDAPSNSLDVATSLVVNGIGVIFVSANTTNGGGDFDITTMKITQTPVYFPPDYGTQELKHDQFSFEENHGQLLKPNGSPVPESEVGYFSRHSNPSYYFNHSTISHLLIDRDTIPDSLVRVDLKIMNANSFAEIFRYEPIEAKKNYFITSTQGITDISSYNRLFIPEVFPNVDLHHYLNTRGLKSYFVFKTPGEAMREFRLQVEGANSSTISGGYLIAKTDLGNINMGMLTAYQATFNPLSQSFVLIPLTASWNNQGGGIYNFNISGYVPFWPVVVYVSKPGATSPVSAPPIDNLKWSTYFGEQGTESIKQSEVDAKNNYYICGNTYAANYPPAGGYQNNPLVTAAGMRYGFIAKFNSQGKLDYRTYYSGTGVYGTCNNISFTQVSDVAIDSVYSIYLVGVTSSNGLVTLSSGVANAFYYGSNSAISGGCANAFIAKLNPSGNVLRFASYYGGTSSEGFNCVKYHNGQIHIGGQSSSSSIPLVTPQPNTYQISTGSGLYVHLDTSGAIKHNTKLVHSIGKGAVDSNGNFYMLGSGLGNVPSVAPAGTFYQASNAGNFDMSFQRFSPADSLTWSTCIGGSDAEGAGGIYIRDSLMVIVGSSYSTNYPTLINAGDSGHVNFDVSNDIVMTKFNLKKGQILWSAYHSTSAHEYPHGVVLDQNYNMFVAGYLTCTGTSGACNVNTFKKLAYTGYYNHPTQIGSEAFIIGFNSTNQRRWTTQFGSTVAVTGSSSDDNGYSLVINHENKVFLSGETNVKNSTLPLVRWNSVCYYDSTMADSAKLGTNYDAFIAMFEIEAFAVVGVDEQKEISVTENITLFPNPNNGIFTIRFNQNQTKTVNVHIINVLGQTVFAMYGYRLNDRDLNINPGTLNKGVYFVNISDGNKSGTIKFIVQ